MRRERSQGKGGQSDPLRGTLFIVGVPIGHPDDLTIRALATLRQVDCIAAKSPQATQALLTHHGIHASVTTYDRENATAKVPILLDRLKRGSRIALVSDRGMPVVYDPGRLLITAALQANIAVEVIPGTSAVVAAAALAGLDGNAFVFEARWSGGTRALTRRLESLRFEPRTMIFFPPANAVRQILTLLSGMLGNRRVVAAVDLTLGSQHIIRGRVRDLLTKEPFHGDTSQVALVVEGMRSGANSARRGKT